MGQFVCWWKNEARVSFLAVVDSDGVNRRGTVLKLRVQSEVLPSYTEYVTSPYQQMTTRLLLVTKFWPSVDQRQSFSAAKFLGFTSNESFFSASTC